MSAGLAAAQNEESQDGGAELPGGRAEEGRSATAAATERRASSGAEAGIAEV